VPADLQLTLSLSDIARLAQVQRPVLSMWRRRSIGSDAPFPAPLDDVSAGERFDAEDVVGWLEATGRGNNREVRSDAPAHTAPAGLSLRDLHQVNGLTAVAGQQSWPVMTRLPRFAYSGPFVNPSGEGIESSFR